MNSIIEKITKEQLNPNVPEFRVGDNIKVNVKIKEGSRERIQAIEGMVIARKGSGVNETFTVRKMSNGVGVEMIYPVHSPIIESITVIRKNMVRRAKLYFVRNITGRFKPKERN